MELAISAVASDLVSRFISSIINKFSSCSCLEEKVERLRHLLLRVETVVEEADARCITNSGMLLQLKVLGDAMYRGYYVLDTFKYRRLREDVEVEVSDGSSALFFATPLKRFHRSAATRNHYNLANNELQSALGNLEAAVTNMTEFVILLGGCERMPRRPYDTYLYMENFMFGRHAEKQQVINILLDNNPLNNAPTILPIIGGRLVGKKTLVAHVCNDERVRSHFASILNLKGDNFQKIDQETYLSGRCLVIVEFVSDVRNEDWTKFYSLLACIGNGSKVVVISRLQKFARFGTVKPICLNNLSFEEYSYLFKVLSFGSTSMDDYPHLASMAQQFPMLLRGSFPSAYALADVLNKNMNTQFWLCILTRWRNVVDNNLSMFGEHPKLLLERDRPTDITKFVSPSAGALRLIAMPPRSETDIAKRSLPAVTFGELIVDPTTLPKGDFDLVAWESRIAPYTKYVHFVPACAEEKTQGSSTRRKRRAVLL